MRLRQTSCTSIFEDLAVLVRAKRCRTQNPGELLPFQLGADTDVLPAQDIRNDDPASLFLLQLTHCLLEPRTLTQTSPLLFQSPTLMSPQ
jgi:hypothetical protein